VPACAGTMTRYRTGNILDVLDSNAVLLFGGNNIVTPAGLVMGAGAALAFRNEHPWLPRALGDAIVALREPTCGDYGMVVAHRADTPCFGYGSLQTKRHWRDSSSVELVAASLAHLKGYMRAVSQVDIHITSPGTGLGGLRAEDVHALLADFDDRLHVWTFGRSSSPHET
jgi:hypothetical protein